MAYSVDPGPHPDFYILKIIGDLKYDDLFIVDELHLNENRLIYILVDKSAMNNTLPEGFIKALPRSFVVHANIGHIACYAPSPILRIAGYMVANITRLQKKITIHQTYDEACHHIMTLIQECPSHDEEA